MYIEIWKWFYKKGQIKNSNGLLIEDEGSNKPNWKRVESPSVVNLTHSFNIP